MLGNVEQCRCDRVAANCCSWDVTRRADAGSSLASVLQAASRLIHGYAIDATIDRPNKLRERRPIVWKLGGRVADQGE